MKEIDSRELFEKDDEVGVIFTELKNEIEEFKKFNFKTFKHKDKANSSVNLGIYIDKKYYDRILELNEIDMEVYNYVQKTKKRY